MNILVTGGAGYIGSLLTVRLVQEGHDVTVLDNLQYQNPFSRMNMMLDGSSVADALLADPTPEEPKSFQFVEEDVRNRAVLSQVIQRGSIERIVHFGEIVGEACKERPQEAESINQDGTRAVADLAKQRDIPLIWNSSSSVYGFREGDELLDESASIPATNDPYCVHKLAGEAYMSENDIACTIVRPATVGGLSPRMRIELMPNHFAYMIFTCGGIELAQPDHYRNVIDVNDVVDAYVALLDQPPLSGTYNLGHHNATKRTFVDRIANLNGDATVIPGEEGGHIRSLCIDSTLLEQATGYRPTRTIEDTVRPFQEILRERPEVLTTPGSKNISDTRWKEITAFAK
ncbi:MAG: NAD(P)-dependent oxidoreductase [Candidatus Woesearchaeota archaeon]|nr:NAD(P)-dependent oxidoreductase [Candidatus Woesearchaeota archaeon]